jgi:hypothetical protein
LSFGQEIASQFLLATAVPGAEEKENHREIVKKTVLLRCVCQFLLEIGSKITGKEFENIVKL